MLCVLDVAIFKQFKGHLARLFRTADGPVTIDTVAGMIRDAYSLATAITLDAMTGKESCAAVNGYAKVGLIPFSKKVLVEGVFGAATEYAARMKKEGPDGQPFKPKPLALTQEDRAALVEDIRAQHLRVKLAREAGTRPTAPPKKDRIVSQLLTSEAYLTQEKAARQEKLDEATAKAARIAARKEKAAANKAADAVKAVARAAKAANKAAAGATAADDVEGVPAPAAGSKRRRSGGESAVEGARKPTKHIRKVK
jgi:hypothetical protein